MRKTKRSRVSLCWIIVCSTLAGWAAQCATAAEDDQAKSDTQVSFYKGLIDNRLPVSMQLIREDDVLTGFYEYTSKGIAIVLNGEIDAKGAFSLTEETDGKKTGAFTGEMSSDANELEGAWQAPGGEKKLAFTAERIASVANDNREFKVNNTPVTITMGYPVLRLANVVAAEKITKQIRADLREDAVAFEKESKESLGDVNASDSSSEMGYSLDAGVDSLSCFSEELVSVIMFVGEYSGGAHPNSIRSTYNFQIAPSGEVRALKLASLFKPGADYAQVLSDLIIKELRKQEAEWVVDGQIESIETENLEHFVVTPRGLLFPFDAYAVGPYAQGQFDVEIPYSALGDILDRAGVLKAVVKTPVAASPAAK